MATTKSKENSGDGAAQDALEHLVFTQLRDLLALERALQRRYSDLQASKDAAAGSQLEDEVLQLKTRADRLYRMMDAMAA